jgi:hypothetical protein
MPKYTNADIAASVPQERWTKKQKQRLINAVIVLRGCDHAFLSAEGAIKMCEPFGVKAVYYKHTANPKDPKGLTLNDGANSAVGIGAHVLASYICSQLNVDYEPKLGRGSQLRACCDALENWINKH